MTSEEEKPHSTSQNPDYLSPLPPGVSITSEQENPHSTSQSPDYLSPLPPEVLEQIVLYLDGPDLANLSFTCAGLYLALNQDLTWQAVTKCEGLHVSDQVRRFTSEEFGEEHEENTLPSSSMSKMEYLVAERVRKNWARSNYKEGIIHHFNEEVILGCSHDHLVALESRRLRVWDIQGKWIRLLASKSVNIDLTNPDQTVYQILVHNGVALLCFNFGDLAGEAVIASDFQQILAFDLLTSDCQEVWQMSGLLGTQYNVIRLLGGRLVILDLLQDRIRLYDIDRATPGQPLIVLEQPRHSVRIPHGDLAASPSFLAVPGKRVPENSPVMTVWDLRSGSRKLLESDRPVCPFRWFQKSAVSDEEGMVYGLLNRFRLLGWCLEDESVVFSLDLTTSPPGDSVESHSWLCSATTSGLLLTVHQELSSVSVLSGRGQHLGKICPLLPANCYNQGVVNVVEQVDVVGLTVVVRVVSMDQDTITCLILASDLSPFIDMEEVQETRPEERLTLMSHVAAQHTELDDSVRCSLLINHTKVFDVQPLGVKFYDYLHTEERFPDRPGCDC